MATRFGYREVDADKLKTRIARDLKNVEHYLDRIARAVPQAGAGTAGLDEAKEKAQAAVSDLHDVIDERTEVAA